MFGDINHSALTDADIMKWAELGGIAPFDTTRINPASIDLTLGPEMKVALQCRVFDASTAGITGLPELKFHTVNLQYGQSLMLEAGSFTLAHSLEYIRLPNNIAGEVKLKSSPARRGIGHMYAGWIDPGFEGQITFEITPMVSVLLRTGMAICQMNLFWTNGDVKVPYGQVGRYQHQSGATETRKGRSEYSGGKKRNEPFGRQAVLETHPVIDAVGAINSGTDVLDELVNGLQVSVKGDADKERQQQTEELQAEVDAANSDNEDNAPDETERDGW